MNTKNQPTLSPAEYNALLFYEKHYDILGQWFMSPDSEKEYLGEPGTWVCRFCKKSKPEVTFRKVAHVVPQLLGNKTLMSLYECDDCNKAFGEGIENDLGNWTKPIRTLTRIRGQSGVPVLKREGSGAWRIEYKNNSLNIFAKDANPPFSVDEANSRVIFKLPRDPYTPIAVLKAFLRIALTLIPNDEIHVFYELLSWVMNKDHSVPLLRSCSVIRTFYPGPQRNDLVVAILLKRKEGIEGLPYIFMVLSYGSEVYQLPVPCPIRDRPLSVKVSECPLFPRPNSCDDTAYGAPATEYVDLMDSNVVAHDVGEYVMHFQTVVPAKTG